MPTRKKTVRDLAKIARSYGVKITPRRTVRKGYTTRKGVKVAAVKEPAANYTKRIKRAYAKVKPYVESKKQEFIFRPLPKTKAARKAVKNALPSKTVTATGFFFKVPKGVRRKDFKIDVRDNGEIRVKARGKRGGVRNEVIREMDAEKIADNPEQAVRDILRDMEENESGEMRTVRKLSKPAEVRIMVNGFDGRTAYSWDAFLTYAPELLKQLQDPNREAHPVYKGSGKNDRLAHEKKGGDGFDAEEIADIFHVKLIYQTDSISQNEPTKRKKAKARPRRRK